MYGLMEKFVLTLLKEQTWCQPSQSHRKEEQHTAEETNNDNNTLN